MLEKLVLVVLGPIAAIPIVGVLYALVTGSNMYQAGLAIGSFLIAVLPFLLLAGLVYGVVRLVSWGRGN